MTSDKQLQKAGNNAQQIQAGTVIIQGITEERARYIFQECVEKSIIEYTADSFHLIQTRIDELANRAIPIIQKTEKGFKAFADPSFQKLLKDAQITAAATEREEDYDTLAELLACHIEKGEPRTIRAAIHGAVKIIDEIDSRALCALTVIFLVLGYETRIPSCKQGLEHISSIFENCCSDELPDKNVFWIDHLECLHTIRTNPSKRHNNFEDILSSKHSGWVSTGILRDSENHIKAIDILKEVGLSEKLLEDNELLPKYVKIGIHSKDAIDKEDMLIVNSLDCIIKMNDRYKEAFHSIWKLYDTRDNITKYVKQAFIDEIEAYNTLSTIRRWWNELPFRLSPTMIGTVLAGSNAKRLDTRLPILELYE